MTAPIDKASSFRFGIALADNLVFFFAGDFDPSSVGLDAPLGSVYLQGGTTSKIWRKTGTSTIQWTEVTGTGGGVVTDNTIDGQGVAGDPLTTLGIHKTSIDSDDTVIIDPGYQLLNHNVYTVDGCLVVDGDFVEVD